MMRTRAWFVLAAGTLVPFHLAVAAVDAANPGCSSPPAIPLRAASGVPAHGWQYLLLPGSQLIDRCLICGRPDIVMPMSGRFRMRPDGANPLFENYAWEEIKWAAGGVPPNQYQIAGSGQLSVGGEVILSQELTLAVDLDNGWTNRTCIFTGKVFAVERPWPMIQLSADQTNGTTLQQFHLDLVAAPLREVWFSTRNGFHAGIWNEPTNFVSPGDLLSSAGRVIRRNQELTARLGIMPVVPDLGLDAAGVLRGGEIAFSVEGDIWSEGLGLLRNGDILSANGRVITNGPSLAGSFDPEPPAADAGLDALQFMPNGEIYFSVTNDFFSERLRRTIRRGDLLSSNGQVVRSQEELTARFKPADPGKDRGLDAIYVWPWGEVWFSVETGFYGQHFESYGPGDLLSDQGYVVCRNLDLMSVFQPLEDLADFGLDSLVVITDTDVTTGSTGAAFTEAKLGTTHSGFRLNWEATGRWQQIEKASEPTGPWTPLTPITLAATNAGIIDAGTVTNQPRAFYRVLVW